LLRLLMKWLKEMLEDCIYGLTSARYKKLKRPAQLAATKPDTCVKILNKSAYYVIKDCAEITLKYLPHYIYSGIRDPISKLRGNVPEQDIIDFANRSSREDHTQQLLRLILDDITRETVAVKTIQQESTSIDFTLTGEEDDVYGDYEYGPTEELEPIEEVTPVSDSVNINDASSVIYTLKQALL